jgi:hypothetical protein
MFASSIVCYKHLFSSPSADEPFRDRVVLSHAVQDPLTVQSIENRLSPQVYGIPICS